MGWLGGERDVVHAERIVAWVIPGWCIVLLGWTTIAASWAGDACVAGGTAQLARVGFQTGLALNFLLVAHLGPYAAR
jgi:hypothetical protein